MNIYLCLFLSYLGLNCFVFNLLLFTFDYNCIRHGFTSTLHSQILYLCSSSLYIAHLLLGVNESKRKSKKWREIHLFLLYLLLIVQFFEQLNISAREWRKFGTTLAGVSIFGYTDRVRQWPRRARWFWRRWMVVFHSQ